MALIGAIVCSIPALLFARTHPGGRQEGSRAASLAQAAATPTPTAAPPTPTPRPTPIPTPTPTPNPTYGTALFIGDSLTGGYFVDNQAHAFTSIVAATLHAALVPTSVYYGHSAVDALQAMEIQTPPATDLVVLELGTNDQEDLGLFARDYAAILTLLQRVNARVQLVCLGPWQPHDQDPYNAMVRQSCAHAGGRFVDLMPLYYNESYHGPVGRPTWLGPGDWFHPKNAGMAAIAQAILAALGR